jgi:hypothetical protein
LLRKCKYSYGLKIEIKKNRREKLKKKIKKINIKRKNKHIREAKKKENTTKKNS